MNSNLLRYLDFAIALFGLFFMSGTLMAFIVAPQAASSPLTQVFGASLGLYATASLLLSANALPRILTRAWLPLVPVAFAIISVTWSDEVTLSLRRAGALGLTTAFGFWLATRFSPKELFGMIALVAVVAVLGNFLYILLEPRRGIHQPWDQHAAHHAGSWRGLFGHKNDFGRLISLLVTVLLIAFLFRTGGRALRWGFLPVAGLALFLIVQSKSSQAVLLAAVVPMAIILVLSMRRMSPSARAASIVIMLPLSLIALLSAQVIFTWTLEALGRDASLTGRTEIWEGVILSMTDQVVLGGGYGTGWDAIAPRMYALTGIQIGHAHNGYLDLAVDIGALGLFLTLAFMIAVAVLSFRSLMNNDNREISAIAITVVVFSLIGNIAGSFLLLYNSLYWALLVAIYVQLRNVPERATFDGTLSFRRTSPHTLQTG